jgi:hypothetical protein
MDVLAAISAAGADVQYILTGKSNLSNSENELPTNSADFNKKSWIN